MNGNDRVLWWAYSQFMQYRNFNMIRNLAHGSPISPLLQIYLKVNFIPANRKLKFTETQLFSFKKVLLSSGRGLVEILAIWFTLFTGLLHVCLLQSPSCKCITSQRRRPCHKSIPYFWATHICRFTTWLFPRDCLTDLITLRFTLNMFLFTNIARVTPVKASEGIFTRQSYIIKVS